MLTLYDALKELIEDDDINSFALDDGTRNWHTKSLLEELEENEKENEEEESYLNREVYMSEKGIYFFREDCYINGIPAYAFKDGLWSPDGDFI
jgi:hypothetical protein